MLSYGLLLGLILQATGTPGQPDAAQIFRAAIEAADIRSQGPFLLEAKITATSKNALEGKYRLIFQSESQWREEIVIGADYLIRVQSGNTVYIKSKSPPNNELLRPFEQIGDYPGDFFAPPPGATWQTYDKKIAGQIDKCLRTKSVPGADYCFLDGLFVGDSSELRFSDFRQVLGEKYPFSWKTKINGISYAATVERVERANIPAEAFAIDGTFTLELKYPCSRTGLTPARLVKQPRPDYPIGAKMSRVQGQVILQVRIGEDGAVKDMWVVSGHPMLLRSALDAVRSWKYEPTLCEGRPIPAITTISVNYSLSGR